MPKFFKFLPAFASSLLLVMAFPGCHKEDPAKKGKVVIRYWEKLSGFEAVAVRAVVDDFNKSQDRIFVDFSSISQIDHKFMLATAGGIPPDVAGLYSNMIPVYSENNALTPLDKFAEQNGIKREDYIDIFWQLCCHKGHLWALPSTPASIGLIWNKKIFREAGLDPEKPPRSIAEIEEYNKILAKYRPDGRLERIGFLPQEPDWYTALYGYLFGGELWDGKNITANSRQNVEAYEWIESYPRRFGSNNLIAFRDGFGIMASPQNPFITGRVAMEMQGSWIYNYIKFYAPPDFEWGVTSIPTIDPSKSGNLAIVESDVLVIPAGAKHPKEAFEFIKYVNSRKPMEKLCMGKLQFSPLKECSPEFFRDHPNPNIKAFLELAKSPSAFYVPRISTWTEYNADMRNAVTEIWTGKVNATDALNEVQERQQQIFARRQERWKRLSPKLFEEWSK